MRIYILLFLHCSGFFVISFLSQNNFFFDIHTWPRTYISIIKDSNYFKNILQFIFSIINWATTTLMGGKRICLLHENQCLFLIQMLYPKPKMPYKFRGVWPKQSGGCEDCNIILIILDWNKSQHKMKSIGIANPNNFPFILFVPFFLFFIFILSSEMGPHKQLQLQTRNKPNKVSHSFQSHICRWFGVSLYEHRRDLFLLCLSWVVVCSLLTPASSCIALHAHFFSLHTHALLNVRCMLADACVTECEALSTISIQNEIYFSIFFYRRWERERDADGTMRIGRQYGFSHCGHNSFWSESQAAGFSSQEPSVAMIFCC